MLQNVILELVDEKGLDQASLKEVVQEGILAAYQKKYPESHFQIILNEKDDELSIRIEKNVVTDVQDDINEISVRKARYVHKDVNAGDTVWVDFEGSIGRVEILKARQVIASKIREIEALSVYNEFIEKEGTIVHGTIHKVEHNGITVMLRDTLAFLPKSLSIPSERYIAGRPVKALLKEVHKEYRSSGQLILDRASKEFLVRILELEIPEIYDQLIEIKAASRKAGYKSKIIVASNDPNIDPVGTCVGVGGGRIKPILKELCGEKIDVVSWVNSTEEMVKSALRPAEINQVELLDGNKARVWVSEDQRAYAIGKNGQNISLASELLDLEIELVASGDIAAETIPHQEQSE